MSGFRIRLLIDGDLRCTSCHRLPQNASLGNGEIHSRSCQIEILWSAGCHFPVRRTGRSLCEVDIVESMNLVEHVLTNEIYDDSSLRTLHRLSASLFNMDVSRQGCSPNQVLSGLENEFASIGM